MQEFVVDLAGVSDDEAMHDALAARLPLPSYYGRNLDAFYDVLTEFGSGWRIVFRNAGPVADGLRDVCRGAMEETDGLEVFFEDEKRKDETMDNEVLKALRERRSVRAYRPEQIKDEELKAVLDAGTYAPTGMGWQDPWIVAVQDPETVAQLVRMNAKVMDQPRARDVRDGRGQGADEEVRPAGRLDRHRLDRARLRCRAVIPGQAAQA